MAGFCYDCSMDLFGSDFRDLAGLTTALDTANGFGVEVLCEGCGPILVDHNGVRIRRSDENVSGFFRADTGVKEGT